MQKFHIDVVKGCSTYYELGKIEAEKFVKTPLYPAHSKRRSKSIRQYSSDIIEAKQYYQQFVPSLWQELEGVSSVLDWTYNEVMHEYSGYQQDWRKSGCSALMNGSFFARNYDYHPKTYEGRLMLWKPLGGYASIGISGRMIGRIDGMNEKGLVVGFHFVNRRNPAKGFICTTIARFLLDSCATTEEAITLLELLPHRHAFNYSLLDIHGDSAVVEASGRGVSVNRNTVACTNHFQSDELALENRYHIIESEERLKNLKEYYKRSMTPMQAYDLFNDPEKGIFKKNYGSWSGTIHTVIYIPSTLTMIFGLGENAAPITINFGKWLETNQFPITKIFGVIDSKEKFSHVNSN